jgi:hypothetical protein
MAILSIQRDQPLLELQKQFNDIFPYLKIEFFAEPHVAGQLSPKNKMVQAGSRVCDVQKVIKSGKIDADENMTVTELEQLLSDSFGLHAQVFRKSGRIWLETSATDNWTLKQQNEEGKSLQQLNRDHREL